MSSSMIRINEASKETLHMIAKKTGESMQAVLDHAIEVYRRKEFLREVNQAYAALRKDPKKWAEIEKERSSLEGTLLNTASYPHPNTYLPSRGRAKKSERYFM